MFYFSFKIFYVSCSLYLIFITDMNPHRLIIYLNLIDSHLPSPVVLPFLTPVLFLPTIFRSHSVSDIRTDSSNLKYANK